MKKDSQIVHYLDDLDESVQIACAFDRIDTYFSVPKHTESLKNFAASRAKLEDLMHEMLRTRDPNEKKKILSGTI